MKICSQCGTQNKPTAGFCRGCGAALGASAAPQAPTSQATNVCHNGHVYEGAVCPYCPRPSAGRAAPTMPESSSSGLAAAVGSIPRGKTKVEGAPPARSAHRGTVVEEAVSQRLVGWLVVLNSGEEASYKDFRIHDGKNMIGRRGGSATIAINDSRISTEHCLLVHKNGKYRLTDLGSANGTLQNGENIDSVELADGDRIKVGRTTLIIRTFLEIAE